MSDTPDDFAEWLALAGSESKGEPKAGPASQDYEPAPEPAPGKLTQYRMIGGAFAPSTSSKPKLPSGVYQVEWIDGVGLVFQPKKVETDTLLRLPDSKSDQVIKEVEHFWKMKDQMTALKYIHKRGFLLWGPPGSGKTSTVSVVIQQMIVNNGIVFTANCQPSRMAKALAQFREVEPDRPLMVIFEDLDAIIDQWGEAETLAILDGESSVGNVVFIATTNYPQNLDGRVVNRPSRFDRVVKIGMPNAEARQLYLESRGVIPDMATAWVELTHGFSIAHLKELIVGVMVFGETVDNVLTRLRAMAKLPTSEEGKSVGFAKN